MQIQFSVIIPTFNRPSLLKKCLGALLRQETKVKYEVIVVSDGNDKATETVLKEFENENIPFTYTALDKKSGPAAARNKGWRMAKGELIIFTDDDTQPSRTWLQNYWKAYVAACQKAVAFTGKVKVPVAKRPTDYERNTAGLETAEFVTANCAITKSALQIINGFDEDFTMAWREDSEIQFKLLKSNIPIVKTEDALVVHPARKAAWGISLKEQKKSMFNALLYKKHPQLFRANILPAPLWNYYFIIGSFVATFILLLAHHNIAALTTGSFWLVLVSRFITKRLHNNSLAPSHVVEMIVTSLVIPFLSVFWTVYGAFKFKVFFL